MFKHDQKILVAGGNLFLGNRTLTRLQELGIPCISTENIDLCDLATTKKFFEQEQPQIVIHCDIDTSGLHYLVEQPGDIFFRSTMTSINLQEASRSTGVKKFINPIAYTTYPTTIQGELREDFWWNGPFYETVSVIGLVRKNSWMNTYAYNKQYGLKYANLIIPNIYGPEDYFDESRSYAMGSLMKKMVEAKKNQLSKVIIWGTGQPIRDWVYVDDVIEAFLHSIDIDTGIEPINIGSGHGVSITELASLLKDIIGFNGEFIYDRTKPDGVPIRVMNIDRMKNILKWQPPTSLEDGIKKTLSWYLEHSL